MSDPINKNQIVFIINAIENSVIAASDAVAFFVGKFNTAGWPRIGFKRLYFICYLIKKMPVKAIKVFLC